MTSTETTAAPTVSPARSEPLVDEGDHERMSHIVLEGYTPKDGDYVSAGPSVVEGNRERHRRPGALRQGLGPGSGSLALPTLSDLQGDRPGHGLEAPEPVTSGAP